MLNNIINILSKKYRHKFLNGNITISEIKDIEKYNGTANLIDDLTTMWIKEENQKNRDNALGIVYTLPEDLDINTMFNKFKPEILPVTIKDCKNLSENEIKNIVSTIDTEIIKPLNKPKLL